MKKLVLYYHFSFLFYKDSNEESDGSSGSDNESFGAPSEPSGSTHPFGSFARKRLSTESSTAVSDDEFGLRRKRSMSLEQNQAYYSPPPVVSDSERKYSVSSDQGKLIYLGEGGNRGDFLSFSLYLYPKERVVD